MCVYICYNASLRHTKWESLVKCTQIKQTAEREREKSTVE